MTSLKNIILRQPVLEDGMALFNLVANSPPLDTNSSYCNLLQCCHFSQTGVAAEENGNLVGFISGYRIPERPNTLFVWQVAVAEQARGQGLASKMLEHILDRQHCQDIQFIETTITESNTASWALFKRLAKSRNTQLQSSDWLDKAAHFDGQHDSEALVRVGPFNGQHTK